MTGTIRSPSARGQAAAWLLPLLLAACAVPAPSGAPNVRDAAGARVAVDEVQARMSAADVILLGEVHDHPGVHAARSQLLRSFVERHAASHSGSRSGSRSGPVKLVMEHFDVDREAELDAARRAAPRDVDAWIAAGVPPARTGGGWPWPLLRPVLELARDRDMPVRAANLPRSQLRAIPASGAAPPTALSPEAADRLRATLDAGHCGMLKPPQLQTMLMAQEARDRRMAEAIIAAKPSSDAPVLLLAGNGHVRRDFGVPAQLRRPGVSVSVLAIGFIEQASLDEAIATRAYDFVFVFAPHPREDPCAGLQRTLGAPPKPG